MIHRWSWGAAIVGDGVGPDQLWLADNKGRVRPHSRVHIGGSFFVSYDVAVTILSSVAAVIVALAVLPLTQVVQADLVAACFLGLAAAMLTWMAVPHPFREFPANAVSDLARLAELVDGTGYSDHLRELVELGVLNDTMLHRVVGLLERFDATPAYQQAAKVLVIDLLNTSQNPSLEPGITSYHNDLTAALERWENAEERGLLDGVTPALDDDPIQILARDSYRPELPRQWETYHAQ